MSALYRVGCERSDAMKRDFCYCTKQAAASPVAAAVTTAIAAPVVAPVVPAPIVPTPVIPIVPPHNMHLLEIYLGLLYVDADKR